MADRPSDTGQQMLFFFFFTLSADLSYSSTLPFSITRRKKASSSPNVERTKSLVPVLAGYHSMEIAPSNSWPALLACLGYTACGRSLSGCLGCSLHHGQRKHRQGSVQVWLSPGQGFSTLFPFKLEVFCVFGKQRRHPHCHDWYIAHCHIRRGRGDMGR
ncbi:hypothetical protein EV126DRAFT_155651 [Verticillium dahliae]|nr:hypothetical protein EV126DRAFT_155651 [Verticillium dahliae]